MTILSSLGGWGTVVLYVVVGAIFILHGAMKLRKPSGIAHAAWGGMVAIGVLHGLVEVVAGLAIAFGMFLPWSALILAVIMLGALYFKIAKWHAPFIGANGWEFDLLLLAACLFILLG